MKFKIVIFSVITLIAIEGIVLLEPSFSFPDISLGGKTLAQYADVVLEKCAEDNFPPNCYDREIPKLMDNISMEDAFKVTRFVQEKDNRYLYCHVLGHKLSYIETAKDPDKWMDVITRCPTTMCNNGCLHGSMMERFKSESLTDEQIEELKPDAQIICEPRGKWKPKPIEQSMCYHAIGHLFMYVTNADLKKSADLCEFVGKKPDGRDYVQTCTEGVFMQVFQPLEPEDFALVADIVPKKEKAVEFCEPFKDKPMRWEACRRETWPLFRTELMDPKYMEKFCSFSDRPYAYYTCQAAIMNMVTVNLAIDKIDADLTPLVDYCMALSTDQRKSECLGWGAGRLMQIDPVYTEKALEICSIAASKGLSEDCYQVMSGYGHSTFDPGSSEQKKYCDKLPADWKDRCLNRP